MKNIIRREDLSNRSFWTKDLLRRHFGYDGPEKGDEFIKWAYMRIWYSNDFKSEIIKDKVCDALRWGYIISLYDYAAYYSAYKDCEVDFESLDSAIEALERIRKGEENKRAETKPLMPEELPGYDAEGYYEEDEFEDYGPQDFGEEKTEEDYEMIPEEPFESENEQTEDSEQ